MSASSITVLPGKQQVEVSAAQNLFQALAEAGISLNQACGGHGICGKCRVRIESLAPPPTDLDREHLSAAELDRGFRLACAFTPTGGEVVELIPAPPDLSVKLELGQDRFPVDPWPGLARGDLVMAIDLGTTNVVGHLLDPLTGRLLESAAVSNGQAAFGADVMTRLAYASHGGRACRERLQRLVLTDLGHLGWQWGPRGRRVRHGVAVMNTAMESCLLNWDPDALGRHPCEAQVKGPVRWVIPEGAGDLAGTQLHLPPVVGGYVGSDTVAALWVALERCEDKPFLLLDIGTNTEAVLVTRETVSACSSAAGPAFEGGGIAKGMRAAQGAIDAVKLRAGRIECSVIGGGQPRGIAGSGLFSLLGELVRAGAVDRFGVFHPDRLAPETVTDGPAGREVQLGPHVAVTEEDVQHFLLAKASARAGVEVLLSEAGLQPGALQAVLLSGTFASRLRSDDILAIGLVPPLESRRLRSLGNAAALGAALMACSRETFHGACELSSTVAHVRLSGHPLFQSVFPEQVRFGSE